MFCLDPMKTLRRMLWTLSFLLAVAATAAAAPPSPESVLGFRPGADRKLADWTQIVDYFRRLDAASDRVKVEEVGRTTEDRPFLVVGDHVREEHGAPRGDPPREPAPGRPARPERGGGGAPDRDGQDDRRRSTTASIPTRSRPRRPRWRRRTPWPRRRTPRTSARSSTTRCRDDPVAQPGRHADGHRVVPPDAGHALGGPRPAVPVPEVHRPRQQPRLVHVHAGARAG